MMHADEEFLTVAEVAGILKLNQQTVRNWIDQGSLPALRVGRRVRVRRADFEALLERGRTGAPTQPEPTTTATQSERTRAATQSDRTPAQAFWDGDLEHAALKPSGLG